MKPGEHAEGKPRGERFKAILRDLQAMAAGEEVPPATPAVQTEAGSTQSKPRQRHEAKNVPLAESANERARGLVRSRCEVRRRSGGHEPEGGLVLSSPSRS